MNDGSHRGFFAIGIYRTKTAANVGTLWRSASSFGAAFVFTVGRRYQRQASDTSNTPLQTPLIHFDTVDDLHAHLPHGAPLLGVEMHQRSRPLSGYCHPPRAVYMLGAEDHGLPEPVIAQCYSVIEIETLRLQSLNVAVAGSILMHHRHTQRSLSMRAAA